MEDGRTPLLPKINSKKKKYSQGVAKEGQNTLFPPIIQPPEYCEPQQSTKNYTQTTYNNNPYSVHLPPITIRQEEQSTLIRSDYQRTTRGRNDPLPPIPITPLQTGPVIKTNPHTRRARPMSDNMLITSSHKQNRYEYSGQYTQQDLSTSQRTHFPMKRKFSVVELTEDGSMIPVQHFPRPFSAQAKCTKCDTEKHKKWTIRSILSGKKDTEGEKTAIAERAATIALKKFCSGEIPHYVAIDQRKYPDTDTPTIAYTHSAQQGHNKGIDIGYSSTTTPHDTEVSEKCDKVIVKAMQMFKDTNYHDV